VRAAVVTHEQGWGPPDWLPQETIDEGLRTIPFPLGYRCAPLPPRRALPQC